MRHGIAAILLFIFITGTVFASGDSLPLAKIETLYATPNIRSNLVYRIPIEVVLFEVSEDVNWYKVRIAFDLGILGKYSYIGWTELPVGKILAAREEERQTEIAELLN